MFRFLRRLEFWGSFCRGFLGFFKLARSPLGVSHSICYRSVCTPFTCKYGFAFVHCKFYIVRSSTISLGTRRTVELFSHELYTLFRNTSACSYFLFRISALLCQESIWSFGNNVVIFPSKPAPFFWGLLRFCWWVEESKWVSTQTWFGVFFFDALNFARFFSSFLSFDDFFSASDVAVWF